MQIQIVYHYYTSKMLILMLYVNLKDMEYINNEKVSPRITKLGVLIVNIYF